MKRISRLFQGRSYDTAYWVIGLVLLGFAIRVGAALLTYGTEDIVSWGIVGDALLRGENPYKCTHFLRWPSLWMAIIFVVKHVSAFLHLDFATLIKIPPIAADVAISVVIYFYLARRRGLAGKGKLFAALYAVNPISILIVAVHGQFDSIPVLFLLLSLYCLEGREEEADLYIAAMMLGLAIFAKSWPLLMAPFLIAHVPGRKAKVTFLAISLLPFLVSMSTLYVLAPADIYHKVGGYAGITGWWGLTSLYSVVQHPVTAFISDLYSHVGHYLLLLALGCMSFYYYKLQQRHSLSLLEALVGGILLIYVMIPGYGTQYMLWVLPFVMLYSYEDRFARYFLIGASVELLVEYVCRPHNGILGEWVLRSHDLRSDDFYASYASPADMAITNLLRWPLWIYCGVFLAGIISRWRRLHASDGLR